MAETFDAASAVDRYLSGAAPTPDTTLRSSLADAVGQNPDDVAQWRRTAATIGVPIDTAQALPDFSKKQAALAGIDTSALARMNPGTAGFLMNPVNAAIAHDDVANLSGMETVVNAMAETAKYIASAGDRGGLLRDLGAGVQRANRGAAGVFQAGAELFAPVLDPLTGTVLPENPLRRVAAGFASMGAASDASAKALSPAGSSTFGNAVSSGVQSLAGNLLTLPLAALPGGQGPVLLNMAANQGGQSYQQAREQGLSPTQALPFAASQAVIEYATEKLPMHVLLRDLKSGAGFGKTLLHNLATEIPGEQIATVLQDMNEWAALPENANKPFSSYLADRPSAAAQTLIATVIGAGGQVTVMQALQSVADTAAGIDRKAQAAEQDAARAEQLLQLAEASKLRERDPATFRAFVEQIADGGTVPAELYIDAQTLANSLNQSGVSMAELQALAPSVAGQMQAENYVPGTDVRIPVSELLAAPSEISATLVDHLRATPDAMSRAEAKTFLEQQGDQIRAEVEQELGRADQRAALQEQVDELRAQFQATLDQVGRFRPEVNKAYATLLGNFYATQAQRAGMTPQELMQHYRLGVTSQEVVGGQRLEQGAAEQPAPATGLRGMVESATRALRTLFQGAQPVARTITAADFQAMPTDASGARDLEAFADQLTSQVQQALDAGQEVTYYAEGTPHRITAVTRGMMQDAAGQRWGTLPITTAPDNATRVEISAPTAQQPSAFAAPAAAPAAAPTGQARARGALNFGADITQAPSVIALLEGADLSTFIHETGHFFLEVQADLAARIQGRIADSDAILPGEQQIVDDMNQVLAWFGITGTPDQSPLATWLAMPLDEKRQHHEQFARGFERYTMEGVAPSQELAPLFQRFRAWLVSVYKSLANLQVTLTDDVRAVMNRMLASDEAIQQAQDARAMGPLFQTPEQAGMTPEEYAEYQQLGQYATDNAAAELDARLLKDMKWMSNARNRALRARQQEVAAMRLEIRNEAQREVMAQPLYQAWQFLTGKQDRVAPGTREAGAIDTAQESGRLRTSIVKEMDAFSAETLTRRRMTSENEGLHPDIVADLFGYESGQELIAALAAAEPPARLIDQITDQRMLEQHGDIASRDALERAADEAVHNELRARVIAAELKALAKATKVRETSDSLYTGGTVDVMARAAREFAQGVVARVKLKNLRPKQYAAAEARSARLAVKALGDTAEAAMHKRNQLVNNFAAKAAYEAQAEIAAANELFKKIIGRPIKKIGETRDVGTVQAARAVLAEYGIGTKGDPAQRYLETMANDDPAMYEVLRDKIDALTAGAKPVSEMTVEEFRGLAEEIRGLWHMARRSRQVEIDGKLVDRAQIQAELSTRLHEIGVPARVAGEGQAVTDAERRLTRLQTARAALRRVESWVGVKDGTEEMGPFRKYIWQPVKEAADRYRADKARFIRQYRDLLQTVDLAPSRIAAPELGYTFGFSRGGSGKAEILHAILHTGNESNKRKLLLGRGWATESDVTGDLDTRRWDGFVARMIDQGVLTKADFDFAQGVWDLLEQTKALAQRAHRDVFGRYFDEVTANSFSNKFGTYRGGYVPAMTDAEVVRESATRALQEGENQTLAYAFPSTAKGFTKARVEYNRPLLLDLRTLSTHIDKVLLFSHLEQPVRDVRRVLGHKDVAEPLHRIDPTAFDGLLTPWLNRAARQTVEQAVPGDNGLLRFFSKARQRAGITAMFANVSNTAQQITGFSIAAVKVRPRHLVEALAQSIMAPRQTARAVAEASTYMATRMDNEVAQMNDAINDILLNPSVYEKAQNWTAKHAYFMQSAVDNFMGPIVWNGAYNQALEQGHSSADSVRLADSVVRQTQGSTLPEDVSRIETGNAFVRMFTQFAGYFNMQANLLGTEFSRNFHELGLRRGMGRGLYIFVLGFLVPNMMAEMIAQAFKGGPDDEDKDGSTLDDWLTSVLLMGNVKAGLAMIPGVGQAANAMINTFNKKPYDDRISTSPAVSMIESAVKAPVEIYKAAIGEGSVRAAVRDTATLISLTTGLPATAIARPLGYIAGMAEDRIAPTGPVDTARGLITGTPSPESKR
jgi:hypothetical protein